MPEDGSRLCNVAVLADEARQLQLAIPLARLARVAPLLVSDQGEVDSSVTFGREQGRIVAQVSLDSPVLLRCQRCLEPFTVTVRSRSQVVLVGSEAEAAEMPPELETVLAPEGRMRLADLVEEELLLALPAAPLHPEGRCPATGTGEKFAEPTQRPFAVLGEMLKSARSKQ